MLRDIANNFLDYQSAANDLVFILDNPDQFRFKNGHHRRETLRLLREKHRTIKKTLLQLDEMKLKIMERLSKPTSFAALSILSADDFCRDLLLPPRYENHTKTKTITLKPMRIFPLDHVRKGRRVHCLAKSGEHVVAGDTNIYAHKAKVRIHATVRPIARAKRLELTVTATVQEAKKDWTTFRKNVKRTVLDVERDYPGLRIKRVSPRAGTLWAHTGRKAYSPKNYGGGTGLVRRASGVISDSKGKDLGKLGIGSLHFAPIKVDFSHAEDVTRTPYEMVPYLDRD